ncbi:DNA methyltransferase 3 isoform X3 [Bombus vancouverensis nearcticus]|uniref:DNA methyltransferase 3 isoform X3 n=1 Tax=Bombus vancouverensis nearcticus TaxID=2705178 RepID=UPI00402B486E
MHASKRGSVHACPCNACNPFDRVRREGVDRSGKANASATIREPVWVLERTNLPSKDALQRWAGNSVWSMVCAMELGLISDASRNNAPFHTVSDERPSVQTNATVSKPSLPLENDCVGAASKTTKRSRSSTKRKRKCKSPSRSKAKHSSIGKATKKSKHKDRGDDSATANNDSNTVDKFWKSRKAGLDRSEKRTNQESESSQHLLPDEAGNQHHHRDSIVAERDDDDNSANRSNHAANGLAMQIDVPQTRASDQQVSYENDVANFVSPDYNRTEESDLCVITVQILETNELDAFQTSTLVLDEQKEQMVVDNDEDVVERRSSKEECNNEDTSTTNNHVEDNASMADRMETEDSSEQPPENDIALERFDQAESTSFDDTDTLPLAKRISSESRASSEGERNNETTKPVKRAARNKGSRWSEEYYEVRRVTRGSMKISKDLFVGKLVWGCCSGWWPALIIDADHVGMLSEAGKSWVYWIGEARISLLNEKTQIEPFSCNLKSRLAHNSNEARMRVIDATMQMLRKLLGGTLTKPYFTWIERNLPFTIETLDEIRFYPYPDKIQRKLNRLRKKNAKVTEKFLLDQKRESQEKRLAEKAKDSLQRGNVDLTHLPLKEQNPGIITWAKIAGHNWWPAMIIDYRDCCMREPSFGCQWIMWYGDYQLSEVHHQLFLRFDKGMEKMCNYINNTKKHAYLVGVLQASKDYCSRLGFKTEDWTVNDALRYFARNKDSKESCAQRREDSVKIYDKYSACIAKKLNELKNNTNVDDDRTNDIKNSDDLRSAMNGNIAFESLCLKCLRVAEGKTEIHPFFEGSLCKECSDRYKPCMFLFGNDDKCFYCTVCAATGMMIICDKEDCPRVYCTACMKHLLCPTTYEQVLQEDPWECFLCATNNKPRSSFDSIIKPRANWKDKMINMFRTKSNPQQLVKRYQEKKKIRVLSLFDGLGTGLLVLLKLGLAVDTYYASEIDPDALMVTTAHFGDRIVHLGDVQDITKEKIQEIAPIDLLIGGSPCNDLSLANPARLGLYDPKGTGILFFEYCRIKDLLKEVNNECHLFWLFENVASMPTEYRLEINRHLGQEPDTIDSADFSPQHRLRLYWHNLPIEIHSLSTQREQDVQDILTPHCQRYSLVKKIRTVTTKVNSLKQGKLALKPILMKDESDSLWITELEEIFGFPRHYTDVKNLSATKRQGLIGKSWSVQTLTAIFRSLCPFFECNTIETN